jgi:hypothetical protein
LENESLPRRKLTDSDVAARASMLGAALRLCRRDDAAVVKALHETKTVDDVEALDKVTFFDQFFTFLQNFNVLALLDELDPQMRVRATISWTAMVGVYIMRIALGIPSIPQTEGLILTDPALMTLFGLAGFVQRGVTQRGLSRSHLLPEVRGAFSGEVMVDTLVKLSLTSLARVFNTVICILAQAGFFPKKVHAVVDCTDFEATPKYRTLDGSAVSSVTRKKRPQHSNNRHAPKVATTVWGWKVWLMFCPTSGIPIAVYVDRINVDDRVWMLALVMQGKANMGEGRLVSVSFDRGFWDGQDLYLVANEVPFFIPGRSDLGITKEARRIAIAAYKRYQKGLPVKDVIVATRTITVVTGKGKNRREEQEELIVIGIKELDCDTYAEEPPESRVNSKSFVPNRLNAAVVMEDPSYPDPPKDDKYLTILTCAAMESPKDVLFAYDRFDDRSVIENSGNKEAKQAWKLEAPLEKSEAAVYVHAFMVLMMMALMAAFRARQQAEAKASAQGQETGMDRYRREVERANRGKVLVRDGDCYAILWAWELAVLAGIQLRNHVTESVEAILARYGVISAQEGSGGGPSP